MPALNDSPICTVRPLWRMIHSLALILLISMGGFYTPRCAAQHASQGGISSKLMDALNKKGDLTLRDATLASALFAISEMWKINIVVGDDVQGHVKGQFTEAPLHEILDAILLSNGYSYRPVGESLVIMPLEAFGQLNPLFQSATIPLTNGKAQEIVESAKLFSSPRGEIRAIETANSVFVLDFPERVAMIREFVANIDARSIPSVSAAGPETEGQPLSVAYLTTEYVQPADVKEPIEAVLSKDGKVAIMETDRRIVVIDYPAYLARARSVLEQVDIPRPQVRIYALIYDISLADVEDLGFNWNHAVKARHDSNDAPQTLFSLDSITRVPYALGATGATMTMANLSRHFDITAVVSAMQTANDARLLADPNVTVQDNEEATFEAIQEIPYQQLTETQQGGNIGTTAFKESGVKLMVKPTVSRDGTILMHVEPIVSRLAGFTPQDNQPIIDIRKAMTTVRVANRQTLVIGGLRQRSDTGTFNGVAGFKDIRWFGHLFRNRQTDVRESELIVFVMPEIISYNDPPKPRQMAAAKTNLCKLNEIPIAEGCDANGTGCGQTGCGGGAAASADSILPYENGPVTLDIPPGFEAAEKSQPAGQGVTIRTPGSGLRLVRLPPTQRRMTTSSRSAAARVVNVPEVTDMRLRTPYSARYRATGGVYKNGQRSDKSATEGKNQQDDAVQDKKGKSWYQRVLRL